MKRILTFLGLKFQATQFRWGRKLFKGKWYLIENGLGMHFWSDTMIYSCQGRCIKTEEY